MDHQKKTLTLKERERVTIIETLEQLNWHITECARVLGLSRAGLYSKLKVHGIQIPRKYISDDAQAESAE